MDIYPLSTIDETSPSTTSVDLLGLGKKEFLQLLVAQLKAQNPFSQTDNSDFIGQLTQLTTLEQMQQVNENLSALVEMEFLAQTSALIGKYVETYPDSSGETIEGVVSEVSIESGIPMLLVDGKYVALQEIVTVRGQQDGE